MSKLSKRKQNKSPKAPNSNGRGTLLLVGALIGAVAVIGGVIWSNQRSAEAPSSKPTATNSGTMKTVAAETGFQKLVGRWLRPDGGYILEITRAEENGTLQAAYLNPNPIHVAQATATREGSALKMFVELRDVNYPGSTYNLTYDPETDQLHGIYFQALQQQRFEVFFQRQQ